MTMPASTPATATGPTPVRTQRRSAAPSVPWARSLAMKYTRPVGVPSFGTVPASANAAVPAKKPPAAVDGSGQPVQVPDVLGPGAVRVVLVGERVRARVGGRPLGLAAQPLGFPRERAGEVGLLLEAARHLVGVVRVRPLDRVAQEYE